MIGRHAATVDAERFRAVQGDEEPDGSVSSDVAAADLGVAADCIDRSADRGGRCWIDADDRQKGDDKAKQTRHFLSPQLRVREVLHGHLQRTRCCELQRVKIQQKLRACLVLEP